MEWIKASERQPNKWDGVYCRTTDGLIRFIASSAVGRTVYGSRPYLNLYKGFSFKKIEWLDESCLLDDETVEQIELVLNVVEKSAELAHRQGLIKTMYSLLKDHKKSSYGVLIFQRAR